ncbi:MAG: HD-GYP domain-containing protein [Gammaproteobacteria bacterium]|nr:MAG: HD-GYP domain-containing protein [Gammaproteobacteria bacterium]
MTALFTQQRYCLGVALGARDAYTDNHCARVEALSLELGIQCKLGAAELELLSTAARLHDVGKIGIPDSILLKPGRLDPSEWQTMKTHAVRGQEICQAIAHPDAKLIGIVVRHHHEAMDGSGYPDALSGEEIPLYSRIIRVADCYDAMTTTRPHQPARPHERVMEILRSECGTKLDPAVFSHFEAIAFDRERRTSFNSRPLVPKQPGIERRRPTLVARRTIKPLLS